MELGEEPEEVLADERNQGVIYVFVLWHVGYVFFPPALGSELCC